MASQPLVDVQVETRGGVSAEDADYARDKVRAVFGQAPGPVLFARVKLTRYANPAMERPVTPCCATPARSRTCPPPRRLGPLPRPPVPPSSYAI
ncbi:hypothetical protein [Streptomyces sp. NPDC093089]|uniref:hypothetical protein n=1 Tax=Streptomyces sp. NPDC093089 TaxID=3366024 RepID=UPI00380B512D